MDFQSHPFWDKYIEFEDRIGEPANVTRVYCRAFQQITYNFTKYFEKFRSLVSTRPIEELGDEETLESVQKAVDAETIDVGYELAPLELERAIRAKLDQHYLAIYAEVQKAVHERWTFENAIKRSYFHVTDVDESELENWHKYLKYEEEQGDLKRIMFLYERCLVACALYEQFWLRYARWLLHVEKEEDCRQVYMRASCVFVPISKPTVRLHWARFEEKLERKELAKDIHKAILHEIPGHIETIISLAGLLRRQFTFDEAIAELQKHVEESGPDVGGVLAAEQARLFWQVKKSIDEARQVFQNNTKRFSTSKHFWRKYLDFEACQPASEPSEVHERVKAVHELVIYDTYLSADARKELTLHYMEYVLILGGSEATEEYLLLDKAINGYVAPKNASPLPDEKPDDTEQDVAAVAEPSPTAMEM
jgi:pre-mRNA-processing factor 39